MWTFSGGADVREANFFVWKGVWCACKDFACAAQYIHPSLLLVYACNSWFRAGALPGDPYTVARGVLHLAQV